MLMELAKTLDRLMPSATSFADISVSAAKGAAPFRLKSYSVSVSDGKWLKNDSLALEKLRSPVMLLLVHVFILLDTVVGKRIGNKKSRRRIPASDMEKIFNALMAIFLMFALRMEDSAYLIVILYMNRLYEPID